MKVLTYLLRLSRFVLQLCYLFLETVNKYRNVMVFIWILSLIILWAVYIYGTGQLKG